MDQHSVGEAWNLLQMSVEDGSDEIVEILLMDLKTRVEALEATQRRSPPTAWDWIAPPQLDLEQALLTKTKSSPSPPSWRATLSPAAQAVLDASEDAWRPSFDDVLGIVAAALRELADQAGSDKHWHVDQIRAIAAELEGSND